MAAALIGFFGVVIGLAVGRGYGFWAERRSELAEAAVAAAVLAEGFRQDKEASASAASVTQIWTDHRRWLVIHLKPRDYRKLAEAVKESSSDAQTPLRGDDLINTLDALHALFWEEREAFILVPLIHYLRGDTVSERIREILDPDRSIDDLPPRGERSPARTWHGPSEQPTRTLDPQDPAAPE
ncbi:MAG: hypothetical protein ACTHK3_06975 [Solirubrobacterales bacterium]